MKIKIYNDFPVDLTCQGLFVSGGRLFTNTFFCLRGVTGLPLIILLEKFVKKVIVKLYKEIVEKV